MKPKLAREMACAMMMSLLGCAAEHSLFVLVPDPDGHVGSIRITNAQGSSEITQAGEAVELAGAEAEPGSPKQMDPAIVEEVFGEALAAEPPRPAVFLFHFKSGSTEPEGDWAAILRNVLDETKQRDSRDISVNGHTDRSGDPEYNRELSLQRARKIYDKLIGENVQAAFLSLDYHGEGDPLVATPDGVDEPRNRRVEVVVR